MPLHLRWAAEIHGGPLSRMRGVICIWGKSLKALGGRGAGGMDIQLSGFMCIYICIWDGPLGALGSTSREYVVSFAFGMGWWVHWGSTRHGFVGSFADGVGRWVPCESNSWGYVASFAWASCCLLFEWAAVGVVSFACIWGVLLGALWLQLSGMCGVICIWSNKRRSRRKSNTWKRSTRTRRRVEKERKSNNPNMSGGEQIACMSMDTHGSSFVPIMCKRNC